MKQNKFKQTEIGKIPEDWEVEELGNLLKNKGYIRGPFGSALRRPELKKEGIPVYEQEHAIYDRRKFRYFIDNEKYQEMLRFSVEENDLIISCSGTFGKISIIKKEDPKGIISQALLILRPDINKINPIYLKYFFTSKLGFESIASRSLGSVQVNIGKRAVIEKIELAVPPLPEQHAIAKIISSLDEKIELNNKMNKTLEAIGQAIFKKWFIDERKEEWETYNFIDLVKQLKPGTNYQPERTIKGIPFVNVRNIQNGFLNLNDVKYISEEDYERVHNVWLPEENDLLITRIGTLGNVAVIRKEDLPLAVHYNSIDIKQKELSYQFLYFLLKSDIFQEQYHLKKKQSVQEYITIEDVENIKITLPKNLSEMKNFEKAFISLFNKIRINYNENQTLSAIRDALLPKLMSGEIRVKF